MEMGSASGGQKMGKQLWIAVGLVMALGMGGVAQARTLPFEGTTMLEFGPLGTFMGTGTGVATVNGGGTGIHLVTIALGAGTVIGPLNQSVTATSISTTIPSISITANNLWTRGSGTFFGISGGPPLSGSAQLPVHGLMRICLATGCAASLPLSLTATSHASGSTFIVTRGVGIGSTVSGAAGGVGISVAAGAWTIGTATANQSTANGSISVTRMGFVHGPASSTSTTGTSSGVIQLVTPMQITTTGLGGNNTKIAGFGKLTIHFIPEPGLLLLLGSGVAGLMLLGRYRMRQ